MWYALSALNTIIAFFNVRTVPSCSINISPLSGITFESAKRSSLIPAKCIELSFKFNSASEVTNFNESFVKSVDNKKNLAVFEAAFNVSIFFAISKCKNFGFATYLKDSNGMVSFLFNSISAILLSKSNFAFTSFEASNEIPSSVDKLSLPFLASNFLALNVISSD